MNNMFLLQLHLSQLQAGLLFGAALGFLLGLIPLILGIVKGRAKIGILGLIGSTIGSAILGLLLAIPIIGICIYLILKQPSSKPVSEPETSADDSEII